MKIFVTGGTGILGRRVVRLLVGNQHEVVVLSRSARNETLIRSLGGLPFTGNLFEPAGLLRGAAGCDAILHLATSIPASFKPAAWAMNDRIRTEGTRNLLLAAQANQVPFFLQESVALLYGNQNGAVISPATPIASRQPAMLKSAVEMERLVRSAAGENLRYAILRFGAFYASDSAQTQSLIDSVRRGKMPIIGKGDFYWNMIHADDAAAAVVHVVNNPAKFADQTVNVSDFHPLTFREMVLSIAEKTGSKKPLSIPRWLAWLAMGPDAYSVLTASYRLTDSAALPGWAPEVADFRDGLNALVAAPAPDPAGFAKESA